MYPGFLEYFQSFLQNMVGNVINITNLYNKLRVAQENEDQELVYFITGKIVYYLLDFEPIDFEDLEGAPLLEPATLEQKPDLAKVVSMVGVLMQYGAQAQQGKIELPYQAKEPETYEELENELAIS